MARGEIYAQVSCDYYDNSKMIEAGEAAELLYLRALCLSNRLLLDGVITEPHLVALRFRDGRKRADALVRVGLWEKVEAGWRIVGWGERNRSRLEIMALREAEAERKRKERMERRANGQTRNLNGASAERPTGQPPDTGGTSMESPPPVQEMSAPQRSTLNEQRSTLNEQRSASDVVKSEGELTCVAAGPGSPPGPTHPERLDQATVHELVTATRPPRTRPATGISGTNGAIA